MESSRQNSSSVVLSLISLNKFSIWIICSQAVKPNISNSFQQQKIINFPTICQSSLSYTIFQSQSTNCKSISRCNAFLHCKSFKLRIATPIYIIYTHTHNIAIILDRCQNPTAIPKQLRNYIARTNFYKTPQSKNAEKIRKRQIHLKEMILIVDVSACIGLYSDKTTER